MIPAKEQRLGTRARNALYWLLLDDNLIDEKYRPGSATCWTPDPTVIASYTSKRLLRANYIGKVSLAEIIEWLDGHGLILADDPQEKKAERCSHCGQVIRRRKS